MYRDVDASLMTKYEKCTWVHWSAVGAPTFSAGQGTTSKDLAATYDLHYAEYNNDTGGPTANTVNMMYYPDTAFVDLKARMYDISMWKGKNELP